MSKKGHFAEGLSKNSNFLIFKSSNIAFNKLTLTLYAKKVVFCGGLT